MKSKLAKRILAVVLAVITVFVPLITAFAQSEGSRIYPTIYVHGFMAKDVYVNPDDPDSQTAWPPSSDSIKTTVKECLPVIGKFALNHNWDSFGKALSPVFAKLFAPICCDTNGDVSNGSGVRFEYPEKEEINAEGTYDFDYDWRLDPLIIAEQLSDYIDYIIECSGSEKVNIICHSFGGVVTMSYLALYGNSKIAGVCFFASAPYGERYNGEMMSGNIGFESKGVVEYFKGMLSDNDYNYLISFALDILYKSGILEPICACCNYTVEKILPVAAAEAILPLFANWLPIWSMVPDEYLKSAKAYVFDTVYKGEDRSKILSRIDEFNEKVRSKREDILKDLNANAHLIIISGYGLSTVPLIKNWQCNSDDTIDTTNTSFGATVAPYDEKLSNDYLSKAKPEYISPEQNIDASTCQFPEQTWFIHNMKHTASNDCLDEMMMTLLRSDEQPTVNTYKQYPRFLEFSEQNDTVLPHTAEQPAMKFFQKLKLAIKDIFKLIASIFKKK